MLKVTRKFTGGQLKIYDRKPKLDEDGKPVDGEFEEVIHRLSPECYEIAKEVILDEKGNEVMDQRFKPMRPKMKQVVRGKPFEVFDEEYVLKKHGAILEKA